ncbi:hypothetical protein SDC9_103067 [bioreactor metagenome]|uniref:Uncharacterized protein n=1 Tax=bioreactor metagenome TaxID=1076179 RepID=A0A645ASL2_9ZZZZ
MIEFIIIILILLIIFNVVYYIPNKLKAQEEKNVLYLKELYIRLNRLEKKIDEIKDFKENY